MATMQDVTSARESARGMAQQAGELEAGGFTVGDILKEKATAAYKDSQDIIKHLDEATTGYISAPSEAREKYQDVFNPFSREALVSKYTSNKALPMLGLSSMLGNRFGRIEDLVGSGTRAYQAQSTTAQNAATLQRQLYGDLLGEYQWGEGQRTAQEEVTRQQEQQDWERPWQEKLWQQTLDTPPGGGGSELSDLLELLNLTDDQPDDDVDDITPEEAKQFEDIFNTSIRPATSVNRPILSEDGVSDWFSNLRNTGGFN